MAAVRSSRGPGHLRAPSLILLAAGYAAGVVATLLGLRDLAAPFPMLVAPTRR